MAALKPITIVGGGLAGLTLGIGLRQRGFLRDKPGNCFGNVVCNVRTKPQEIASLAPGEEHARPNEVAMLNTHALVPTLAVLDGRGTVQADSDFDVVFQDPAPLPGSQDTV